MQRGDSELLLSFSQNLELNTTLSMIGINNVLWHVNCTLLSAHIKHWTTNDVTEMMTCEYCEVYLYCNMRVKETEGDKGVIFSRQTLNIMNLYNKLRNTSHTP